MSSKLNVAILPFTVESELKPCPFSLPKGCQTSKCKWVNGPFRPSIAIHYFPVTSPVHTGQDESKCKLICVSMPFMNIA